MREPLVSILIPVYNAEAYLLNLMKQLRSQIFINWEVVMVNDGSTDSSGELCEQLAITDHRIRIIHQSNQGVSATRNKLLQKAKGTYIAFVDADDHLDNYYLEKLVKQMQQNSPDLVVCGYEEVKELKGNVISRQNSLFYPDECLDVNTMSHLIMPYMNSGLFNPLWNKLYKREIIEHNRLSFRENVETGEDLFFNLDYFKNIQTLSFINEPLYIYMRRQNNSITYQYIDQMYQKGLDIHQGIEQFLKVMHYDTKENELTLMENHLGGVFSAWLNLFHRDCHLTVREKRIAIKKILHRHYVKECANEVRSNNKMIKLTKGLVHLNSITAVMLCFKVMNSLREGRKKWR